MYYAAGQGPAHASPAPYPPLFFAAVMPFAVLPLPLGFGFWSLLNAACMVWVIYDLCGRFRDGLSNRIARTLLVTSFFSVPFTLLVGQSTGLWLVALCRAYLDLERGRDFRAGLWLGVLLAKPQYAVGILLVLLLKRRWRSLAGGSLIGAVLLLTSLAVVGIDGATAYLRMTRDMSGFWEREVFPEAMIGWRGLLAFVLPPATPASTGTAVTYVLSGLAFASLALIWRGTWPSKPGELAPRMLATLLATTLGAFHNHAYGAALLVVPAVCVLSERPDLTFLRQLFVAALAMPVLLFVITLDTPLSSAVLSVLLVVAWSWLTVSSLAKDSLPQAAIVRSVLTGNVATRRGATAAA